MSLQSKWGAPPSADDALRCHERAEVTLEQSSSNDEAKKSQVRHLLPPGLVGDVADYFCSQSAYPNVDIALAGALGFMAGLCGQCYNTQTGAGLNQYILVLANTGRGKEAIAEGCSKLIEAIKGRVEAGIPGIPAISSYKGPAHFASAEGLIKQLTRSSCFFSIIGEFGLMLRTLIGPKASATHIALKRAFLDLYNKSGDGKVLDPMVYSDTTKNTEPVVSPAFTLIGESTFEEFFEGIDERIITNGLAARFMVFHTLAPRPYLNPNVGVAPTPELVERLRDYAARCLAYTPATGAVKVRLDPEASITFGQFERNTTDRVNANASNVHTELWNRAFIKALKLASLIAAGVNPDCPVVTKDVAEKSISLITSQIDYLTAKFADGEVGEEAGNETKQRTHILRAIANYFAFPIDGWDNPDRIWREHGIIRQSYIQSKVFTLPAFNKDRRGATKAIKDMLLSLSENGELQMAEATAMSSLVGKKCSARAYYLAEYKMLEPYWPDSSPFSRVLDFFCTVKH